MGAMIAIDGIDVMNGADVVALNAALSPAAEGENHSFKLSAPSMASSAPSA